MRREGKPGSFGLRGAGSAAPLRAAAPSGTAALGCAGRKSCFRAAVGLGAQSVCVKILEFPQKLGLSLRNGNVKCVQWLSGVFF